MRRMGMHGDFLAGLDSYFKNSDPTVFKQQHLNIFLEPLLPDPGPVALSTHLSLTLKSMGEGSSGVRLSNPQKSPPIGSVLLALLAEAC
jgi:hypothetical protein